MTHENRETRSEKVYREIRQEACSPICSVNQGRGIFLNPTGSPCKGKEVEALILPLMLTELGAFGQFTTYCDSSSRKAILRAQDSWILR